MGSDSIHRSLSNMTPVPQVYAAHTRLSGETDKCCAQCVDVALPYSVARLGQHDDAAAFRRLVRERCDLRGVGERFDRYAISWHKFDRFTVAQRDRPRLIEQQHIYIPGR